MNDKMKKIVGYTMTSISFALLSLILATPAKAEVHKDIDSCKMVTVAFFQNGNIDEGGVERLYLNFSLAEQKSQAKKWVNETSGTAEVINSKGDCQVNIKYKR